MHLPIFKTLSKLSIPCASSNPTLTVKKWKMRTNNPNTVTDDETQLKSLFGLVKIIGKVIQIHLSHIRMLLLNKIKKKMLVINAFSFSRTWTVDDIQEPSWQTTKVNHHTHYGWIHDDYKRDYRFKVRNWRE